MQGNDRRPAGVAQLLLVLVVLLLLLLLTAVNAAGGGYSARVVIVAGKSGGASTAHRRVVVDDYAGMMAALGQRLEDVVAPELLIPATGGGLVIGAGVQGGGSSAYDALKPGKQVCPRGGCAGKQPGGPYTRPCTYQNRCERQP